MRLEPIRARPGRPRRPGREVPRAHRVRVARVAYGPEGDSEEFAETIKDAFRDGKIESERWNDDGGPQGGSIRAWMRSKVRALWSKARWRRGEQR